MASVDHMEQHAKQAYMSSHDVESVVQDAIAKLGSERPERPFVFLSEYFSNRDRVRKFVLSLVIDRQLSLLDVLYLFKYCMYAYT